MPITMKNILTKDEAKAVVEGYLADGCTLVEMKEETDGTWTVVVNCPEMMPTTMKNIPTKDEAEKVAEGYLADGCTLVEMKEETDGTWTVVVNCPE